MVTANESFLQPALAFLAPRPRVRTIDWCKQHVCTHEGRPYDAGLYPHLSAPDGPFDAFDDPTIRIIWLMFGSRLGKTFFGQCATLATAGCHPGPMMFATQSEKLAIEVTARTYRMLDHCRPLKEVVRPPRQRKQDRMDLGASVVFVGWARSVATLADKSVRVGHGNEIDKWEYTTTSKEGDPLKLFLERGKEYPGRKFILEGTPTVHGYSRIERGFLGADRRKFFVPCPHCGAYQFLAMGDGKTFGVKWDREGDRSDPDLAWRTARYVCVQCQGDILDHHRGPMMRGGRWVREGQSLAADGTLSGTALRRGQESSFHLSSLYALTLSWGDIAAEFVRSKDRPAELRNFVNGWEARTWQTHKSKTTPEIVGERLRTDLKRGIVPLEASFVTIAADKQGGEGGYMPFVVMAHGSEDRAWLVDFGVANDLNTLFSEVINQGWQHQDGGEQLRASVVFVDSGFDTKAVYDFCARYEAHGVYPVKGMDSGAEVEPYRVVQLGLGPSNARTATARSAKGQTLVHINTDFWETDLQHRLEDCKPGDVGSLSLCAEASRDPEFLEQLCNGTLGDKVNNRGVARLLWIKKDPNFPNDFRDTVRYSLAGAKVWLQGRSGFVPVRQHHQQAMKAKAVVNSGHSRPDGRPWI